MRERGSRRRSTSLRRRLASGCAKAGSKLRSSCSRVSEKGAVAPRSGPGSNLAALRCTRGSGIVSVVYARVLIRTTARTPIMC